jgi:hypothetical protein
MPSRPIREAGIGNLFFWAGDRASGLDFGRGRPLAGRIWVVKNVCKHTDVMQFSYQTIHKHWVFIVIDDEGRFLIPAHF